MSMADAISPWNTTTSEVAQHFLLPGLVFAEAEPHIISTVLGSCVAVCLWDPDLKIGGINHYLLPLWNGEGLPTPKYGSVAIEKLIERMVGLGSRKSLLQAKLFGGAAIIRSGGLLNIGERNAQLALEILEGERIQVIGTDLYGLQGRRIMFHTGLGRAKVKLIGEGNSAPAG